MQASKFTALLPLLLGGLFLFTSSCKEILDDLPDPTRRARFEVRLENVLPATTFSASGAAPDGLLMPGDASSFSFHAGPGAYLSFATMFVQSNDLFYAFDESGWPLYDADGNAQVGDISEFVHLWDAGTEVNEAPGSGPNQAPRQSGPDTGMEESGTVRNIADVADGYTYPDAEDVIRVTVTHDGGTLFTVEIANVSGGSSLPSPLSPGVFVVHPPTVQLFEVGAPASEGLEDIAEDGANQVLLEQVGAATGYSSPFSPGLWVVHSRGAEPLFSEGEPDRGEGLEVLAEDGNPAMLADALASRDGVVDLGIFNSPEGDAGPGPLFPGNAYTFYFEAERGDYLQLATMLIESNDLFYAFEPAGLPLFRGGRPVAGEVSMYLDLWDAGTEVNEYPGAGPNQPVRGGMDTGADENGTVRVVDDGFPYPTVLEAVKLTISVEEL